MGLFAMPIVGIDIGSFLDIEIIAGSAAKAILGSHSHGGNLSRTLIVSIEVGTFANHKKGGRGSQELIVTSNRHG